MHSGNYSINAKNLHCHAPSPIKEGFCKRINIFSVLLSCREILPQAVNRSNNPLCMILLSNLWGPEYMQRCFRCHWVFLTFCMLKWLLWMGWIVWETIQVKREIAIVLETTDREKFFGIHRENWLLLAISVPIPLLLDKWVSAELPGAPGMLVTPQPGQSNSSTAGVWISIAASVNPYFLCYKIFLTEVIIILILSWDWVVFRPGNPFNLGRMSVSQIHNAAAADKRVLVRFSSVL